MKFGRHFLAALTALSIPSGAIAQSADGPAPHLSVELNKVQDVDNGCRLTFLIDNQTGVAIEKAVFETVVFDTQGSVVSLSLFDFLELPSDRPRVRQFSLPAMACNAVGQVLINGTSSCIVDGAESATCRDALSLSSRVEMELLG